MPHTGGGTCRNGTDWNVRFGRPEIAAARGKNEALGRPAAAEWTALRLRGGGLRMSISQNFRGQPTIKWTENERWHVHHHFPVQPENLWEFWVFLNDFWRIRIYHCCLREFIYLGASHMVPWIRAMVNTCRPTWNGVCRFGVESSRLGAVNLWP